MARPKYGDGDLRARKRLIDGFWGALRLSPYEKLSVRGLLRDTGLSKNTFYYHFADMGDLARAAIDEITLDDLTQMLLHGENLDKTRLGSHLGEAEDAQRLSKIAIVLSRNGSALQPLFIEKLKSAWLDALGKNGKPASKEKLLLVDFASGGAVNALAGKNPQEYAETIAILASTPAIRSFIDNLSSSI